ncbi:hypothetical protein BAIN110137_21280 [Bacillus inaquosorum]
MWQIVAALLTFPIVFLITIIPFIMFFAFKIGLGDVLLFLLLLFKSKREN